MSRGTHISINEHGNNAHGIELSIFAWAKSTSLNESGDRPLSLPHPALPNQRATESVKHYVLETSQSYRQCPATH